MARSALGPGRRGGKSGSPARRSDTEVCGGNPGGKPARRIARRSLVNRFSRASSGLERSDLPFEFKHPERGRARALRAGRSVKITLRTGCARRRPSPNATTILNFSAGKVFGFPLLTSPTGVPIIRFSPARQRVAEISRGGLDTAYSAVASKLCPLPLPLPSENATT